MIKRTFSSLVLLICVLGFINAQSPKREMRAAWVTTLGRIDWPVSVLSSSGNTSQINSQKNAMITILDNLVAANMNALCFQVRARCDAMYKSSYEPWSSDLVYSRGAFDPGYDPLQFVVEEAHKRGIEVHAWVNPYRFESTTNQWSGKPGDYRATHPSWVLTYSSGYAMLDPGRPDVQQRIKDIIAEIVNNYDIDGVVFDDYFYSYDGTPTNLDQTTQNTYKPASMSVGDWRRKNVTDLVTGVYDLIKSKKPYVTFGVSPFGIWTIQSSVASSYGLTLPSGITGLDAYNTIYCDPVAWLKAGKIDYISPQLYWATTATSQKYGTLSPWWAGVANKYGRHFYASQQASQFTASEIGLQIGINRSGTKNEAPGSILYSMKTLTQTYTSSIVSNYFTHKALPPTRTWHNKQTYSSVTGLSQSGTTLNWNPVSGVAGGARYTVYAIPNAQANQAGICSTSRYLLGISYKNSYTIPSSYTSGYTFKIGLLDRYGYEFISEGTVTPSGLTLGFSSVPNNSPYVATSSPIDIGDEIYLTIKDGTGSYISRLECTLTSSDPSVATISATGVISGLKNGTTTIKAVRHTNGSGEGTISLTVSGVVKPTVNVRLVVGNASTPPYGTHVTQIPLNQSLNRYLGIDKNNSTTNPSWDSRTLYDMTSSDNSIATVSSSGTISTYAKDGMVTFTATLKDNPNQKGSVEIKVGTGVAPAAPLTLFFNPAVASIPVGEEGYLYINDVSGNSISCLDCDLTSSNNSVAAVNVLGTVTGKSIGTVTLKAVKRSDNSQGTISLSVVAAPPPVLWLGFSSVLNTPYNIVDASVEVGKLIYLTIDDGNGYITNRQTCTLSSSDANVASIAADGTITAKKAGTTIITAVRNSDNAKGTINLTVTAPLVPTTLTLTLSSTSTPNNPISSTGIVKDNKGNGVFLWIEDGGSNVNRQDCDLTSSNSAVATISIYGTITTYSIDGTTTIKAVRKSDKKEGTLLVSVGTIYPPSTALWLGFSSVLNPPYTKVTSVEVGKEVYLTIEDDNGGAVRREDCTLTSNNTGIATITATGAVKGINGGTTAISAVRKSDNVKGAINITVTGGVNLDTPVEEKAFKVYDTGTGIFLEFEDMALIELYSVNGILIEKMQAFQSYSRDLAKGVYIVRVNGKAIRFLK